MDQRATPPPREYTDGSTAIVRAALEAGCNFFAGYPITPASPILTMMMREMPRVGGIAVQGEDEIASIGMCIGAVMAGARALTATSGPGISLYSENLGLAVMGEIPLVVVDVQRLGPATGGATTVGQGDVQFVRWGTSGGYPIIALAPSSVPECYHLTMKAFDLAERFRCPVFLLTDKELNMTMATVALDAYRPVDVRPRPRAEEPGRPYRYTPAEDVPPLRHYGAGETVRFTGSTHDERAFITKHPPTVDALNRHLAAKIEEHRDEIEMAAADLDPRAETLVVSYGVTAGAAREAVRRSRAGGAPLSSVVLQTLWPVPEATLRRAATGVRRVLVPELNLGQYRREVERVLPGMDVSGLNRVDGEMITPEQILEAVR
ncbi:MAG: pyruvate flavodoxin/ferredoxin oxidoreductase [Acidimicrobiia bacterium]|nr:pyruvate flavodoxin/ferredoxin oxidoreductase [Acidimicrobiia bacterium]